MSNPQARLLRANSREALVEMQSDLALAASNRDGVKAQLRRVIESKIQKHPDRNLFELLISLGG